MAAAERRAESAWKGQAQALADGNAERLEGEPARGVLSGATPDAGAPFRIVSQTMQQLGGVVHVGLSPP